MKKIFTLFLIVFSATLLRADDYRTISAGAWSDPANWERFDGANWVAAIQSPTSADGVITLLHDMVVGAPVAVDEVVGTGRTMTVNATLTVNNGPGVDLAIGNLNISNFQTVNGSGIINTGTCTLGAGATYDGTGSMDISGISGLVVNGFGTSSVNNATITCNGPINLSA